MIVDSDGGEVGGGGDDGCADGRFVFGEKVGDGPSGM